MSLEGRVLHTAFPQFVDNVPWIRLMPVYEYACAACGGRIDRILPHDRADDPGPCPECDGELARRFSRVAVRYDSWGFNATDGLVPDRQGGRNDFKTVRERAEKLSDTGEL